jgi:hypothetical protein
VLIIFVGPEEIWNAHPAIAFALESLRALGGDVRLFFLNDNMTTASLEQHSVMLSQTSRLFGPFIIKKLFASKSNPADEGTEKIPFTPKCIYTYLCYNS